MADTDFNFKTKTQTASTSFWCHVCGGRIRAGEKYQRIADVVFEKDADGEARPHIPSRSRILKTHLTGECLVDSKG